MQFHARRTQQRPHCSGRASLLADHFAQIVGSNLQFQNGGLILIDCVDSYLVGGIHQRLGNLFNKGPHVTSLLRCHN